MNKATVIMPNGTVTIEAPSGKSMVFDPGLLQHGVLSIGEYGPSGTKVAAFHCWDFATFGAEANGYTITNTADASKRTK